VPATRSRNENWRRSLEQLHTKSGSLEVAMPHRLDEGVVYDHHTDDGSNHVVWRVRVLGLNEDEIIVEQPVALGQVIPIPAGAELIGVIAIGQNRWMFRTENLGNGTIAQHGRSAFPTMRLRMPDEVERCQRRRFYRVGTMGLDLPVLRCSVLLDLDSAAVAEAANRVEVEDLYERGVLARIGARTTGGFVTTPGAKARPGEKPGPMDGPVMPVVGATFEAQLMNIGGGGVGIIVERNDRAVLEAARHLWLQIDLRPHLPAPIGVTARVRHKHIDSTQRLYCGLSFEFSHSPKHERFIVDQLCRYVVAVQRAQGVGAIKR
jgi:c-di-GMP-binding flagellar brake protein YcgR